MTDNIWPKNTIANRHHDEATAGQSSQQMQAGSDADAISSTSILAPLGVNVHAEQEKSNFDLKMKVGDHTKVHIGNKQKSMPTSFIYEPAERA